MAGHTGTAQAPRTRPISISFQVRPAELLRECSDRIFGSSIESPQCGHDFCQACNRSAQAHRRDQLPEEFLPPRPVPSTGSVIDRIAATQKKMIRSNSAPQLVTAYSNCPRVQKRNEPISQETLKLLRIGMMSRCKCWLHEYAVPSFNFLAFTDLTTYLKADVNRWPDRLLSYFPEATEHWMLAVTRHWFVRDMLIVACWILLHLVSGYQSSLFSRMGSITGLKTRPRLSRAILESARVAWVYLFAEMWQAMDFQAPDVLGLCLRMVPALMMAFLCTQGCRHRQAIEKLTERAREQMSLCSSGQVYIFLAVLFVWLSVAPGWAWSTRHMRSKNSARSCATKSAQTDTANAVAPALPVNGLSYI